MNIPLKKSWQPADPDHSPPLAPTADEVVSWEGHPPEVLQGMLHSIAKLRSDGLDVIDD